ncbi:MAG: type II secretion system F family protein [bacterium]
MKFARVPISGKIFFLQNLSVMIKAGVPLDQALKTLGEQGKNRKLEMIINEMIIKVNQGKSFSESLEPYKYDFGEMFINMIKAGEAGGNLESVLQKLYLQTKRDHTVRSKIKNALTYPAIIIVAMVFIAFFMAFFVLPNITKMFADINTQLPLVTRVLIGFSDFCQNNVVAIIIVCSLLVLGFIEAMRTKRGRHIFDLILLEIPIVSGIIKKINLASLARNLSSLIQTDIPIDQSLVITSRVLNNSVFRLALAEAAEQVKKGKKLDLILKNNKKIFPPLLIQMIAIGEETGSLEEILQNLADFYEEDVSQTMDTLPTIIEPVLMLTIGIGVAGIALAILMPIYSLSSSI